MKTLGPNNCAAQYGMCEEVARTPLDKNVTTFQKDFHFIGTLPPIVTKRPKQHLDQKASDVPSPQVPKRKQPTSIGTMFTGNWYPSNSTASMNALLRSTRTCSTKQLQYSHGARCIFDAWVRTSSSVTSTWLRRPPRNCVHFSCAFTSTVDHSNLTIATREDSSRKEPDSQRILWCAVGGRPPKLRDARSEQSVA